MAYISDMASRLKEAPFVSDMAFSLKEPPYISDMTGRIN
jgi:hypothetical protein